MPQPKTIRALERGLQVLDALRASPISSLHDIARGNWDTQTHPAENPAHSGSGQAWSPGVWPMAIIG